jgi:PTS system mannose-specific IIB component/fructoselysine and glucoselysine-specific PTS system IIB component
MIKLLRIDDRLLHGQVALTWTPSLGADTLVIANDKVAKDEFQKMTLGLAKPAGTKLYIKSVTDTIVFLNDEKFRNLKILLLVNSVNDAASIAAELKEIRSINFGGLRTREGARQISKAIALTEEDISIINTLAADGIELEIRQVPSDKKQLVQELVK